MLRHLPSSSYLSWTHQRRSIYSQKSGIHNGYIHRPLPSATAASSYDNCRSIISPSDIVHFDEIVSAQEVKVLQQTHSSDTEEEEENSDEGTQVHSFSLQYYHVSIV